MGTPALQVSEPGLLTTVQDLGYADAVHLGVPPGGACDPYSLALANALCGNPVSAAGLEITLAGPTVRLASDCLIGLAGADFDARVTGGRQLRPGTSFRLRAGETLSLATPRDGTGIRAYLAVGGGVDVPQVLGSRSTCLVGGFGGFEGRALRSGDVIEAVAPGRGVERTLRVDLATRLRFRIVAGPDLGALGAHGLESLTTGEWLVGGRSDRQGIRLEGPAIRVDERYASMLSQGVVWGAIQLPPDGQPICLLADHQTVGGYPVPAVVASVDRPALGQLGAGDSVTFERIEIEEAQALARTQAANWAAMLAGLAVPV